MIKVLTDEQIKALNSPLPAEALTPHPTRKKMTVIHPMYVVARLHEVFGVGKWSFKVRDIDCTKEIQKTRSGDRTVYMSSVHGALEIEDYGIYLEQFGGSTNDDKGDALKGGATDALTKCASYLGIGAYIYRGELDKPVKGYPSPYTTTDEDDII